MWVIASLGNDKGTELNHGEIRVRGLIWEVLKGEFEDKGLGFNQERMASIWNYYAHHLYSSKGI